MGKLLFDLLDLPIERINMFLNVSSHTRMSGLEPILLRDTHLDQLVSASVKCLKLLQFRRRRRYRLNICDPGVIGDHACVDTVCFGHDTQAAHKLTYTLRVHNSTGNPSSAKMRTAKAS